MTVVRKFGNAVAMQTIVDKFDEYEKKKAWSNVFMALQNKSESQEQELGLTQDFGSKEINQLKNRYCNIIPYDHNLLKLSSTRNGYINASPFHSEYTNRDYIFTQGPLESTSGDFWAMIWEHDVSIIVMLTDVVEWGQIKCHPYFPTKDSDTAKRFGNYTLELEEENCTEAYVIRKIKITSKNEESIESRTVTHFQMTDWPDFGVPEETEHFRKFVESVRDLDDSFKDHKAPIVTHCSAGVGRSGTFVVSDILLSALRNKKTELPMIDDLVLHMRQFRMWLIQTPGQFRFCWQAVVEWIRSMPEEMAEESTTNDVEEKVNGEKSVSASPSSSNEKCEDANGEVDREEPVAILSPGKRASTDEDMITLQKRREKIEAMRSQQRNFEKRKARRDYWFSQAPYFVGSAALVGLASLLIYRYFNGSAEI